MPDDQLEVERKARQITSTSHVLRVKLMNKFDRCMLFQFVAIFMHTMLWINFYRFDDAVVWRIAIKFPSLVQNFFTFCRSTWISKLHQTRTIPWPNSAPLKTFLLRVPLRSSVECAKNLFEPRRFWELSPSFAHEIIDKRCKFEIVFFIEANHTYFPISINFLTLLDGIFIVVVGWVQQTCHIFKNAN